MVFDTVHLLELFGLVTRMTFRKVTAIRDCKILTIWFRIETERITNHFRRCHEILSKVFFYKNVNNWKMSTPPLDYGFMEMSSMSELVVQKPRQKVQHEVPLDTDGKYVINTLKLNNNNFTTMDGLLEALPKIISMPESITWIDLSFNKLAKVEPVLVQLKNLHILYLHGNAIADFPHLEILNRATLLKTLTLHGNPVDRTAGYRFIVLSWLRQLKNLDFSAVTEFDRMQAELWGRRWSIQKAKLHGRGY